MNLQNSASCNLMFWKTCLRQGSVEEIMVHLATLSYPWVLQFEDSRLLGSGVCPIRELEHEQIFWIAKNHDAQVLVQKVFMYVLNHLEILHNFY